MDFSRQHPSPRYGALLAQYGQLHSEGERHLGIPPEQTFPGSSLRFHLLPIKQLVELTAARTLLDYGCGKGMQYRPQPIVVNGERVADSVAEFWDVDEVTCFDPAYPPHAAIPRGRFDGVISTDVLEHCPEEDLPWIVADLFRYAEKFVFANVACFPARKRLPTGENAHCTIRPPQWWRELFQRIAASHPHLKWMLVATTKGSGEALAEMRFGNVQAPPQQQPGVVEVERNGARLRFAAVNAMTAWRAKSLFDKEPVTIEWIEGFEPGSVFFDIGANVGSYTIFAGVMRECRVYAFEPESQNYAVLNRNIALNGLDKRVAAYCAAVSERSALNSLYLHRQEAGDSCHSYSAEVGFDLKARPAAFVQGCVGVGLDELVGNGSLPHPAYVKVDVDGFEHLVIAGMARVLASPALKGLLIEVNPALGEHRGMLDQLAALGFRHDAAQVARSTRREGPFTGVAEHVFYR